MKILIDGDACPVVKIVEKIAVKYTIPVTIICDYSHMITSEYADVVTVDKGADSADFELLKRTDKGDIIVTQDYGVAAMTLGKGAFPIHQSGKRYTNENIDTMLYERHMSKKARRSSTKHHGKGPRKRTEEDDENFEKSLIKLIEERKEQI